MNIDEVKQYLKKGSYIALNNKLVIHLSFFNLTISFMKLVRHKFNFPIKIIKVKENRNNELPKGNQIIHRKRDGQMLILDDKASWVYRKYTDVNQVNQLKRGHPTIEKFYRVNKVRFINDYVTKEKLINGKVLRKVESSRQIEIFADIINSYYDTLCEGKYEHFVARISTDFFFQQVVKTKYPGEMIAYILSEKDKITELLGSLKWTWNHSDLTPDNIMFDGEQYYIIDTEQCEVMPVLYDIINLIFTFKGMSNNSIPLENYHEGEYDALIKAALEKSAINSSDRKSIVMIMLVLKAVLAWDAEIKKDDIRLLAQRWDAVKSIIV